MTTYCLPILTPPGSPSLPDGIQVLCETLFETKGVGFGVAAAVLIVVLLRGQLLVRATEESCVIIPIGLLLASGDVSLS